MKFHLDLSNRLTSVKRLPKNTLPSLQVPREFSGILNISLLETWSRRVVTRENRKLTLSWQTDYAETCIFIRVRLSDSRSCVKAIADG